jgi:hypothetical protein
MDPRAFDFVRREIEKLKADQAGFLAGGGAKDFAEYRHVCGIIRGLIHAETLIVDLVRKMEFDDE